MMLYTKYESSRPCSFRQDDFWKLHFENLLFDPWPTYATNQNHLNDFGRGPPRDHSCEVWSKSNERFQRRRCLSKKVYTRRTTHDRQRPVTIAHLLNKLHFSSYKVSSSPTLYCQSQYWLNAAGASYEHVLI